MPNGLADQIAMNAKPEANSSEKQAAEADGKGKLFLLSIDRASLLTPQEVAASFQSDASSGLDNEEVERRLGQFGLNEIGKKVTVSPITMLAAQFNSTVVYLLLVAAAISSFGGETLQAFGILLAVLINSIVGFVTEYKAQVSLAALEKLAGPIARVRRNGKDFEIPVVEIVPGDIVILEEGSRVPADIRLLSSSALSLDESMLTGESIPVYKEAEIDDPNSTATVALQGTLILKGRAKGLVVATGNNTKLGQLGRSLSDIQSKATPLQDDLEKLGKQLSIITVVVCVLIFFIGLLKGEAMLAMLQASVALAVAAIPEGLPVVATLALASGTSRMVKLGALIRKLSAVETLGSTEIICTDKTGTLTQNQMTVTDIVIDGNHLKVSGLGYKPEGEITAESEDYNAGNCPLLTLLLRAGVLCNDAKLESHDSQWHIHGDPTEGALLTAALKAGIEQRSNKDKSPRHDEYVFDLNSKRMTTIHKENDDSYSAFTKGAPETVLNLCTSYLTENGSIELDQAKRQW